MPASTPAGAAASQLLLCTTKAQESLASLLTGDVDAAEAALRAALVLPTPPPDTAVACLLSNLGLCALHSGRPGEATEAIRHGLTLLPATDFTSARKAEPVAGWVPLARAQVHLNLCEALIVQGQLIQTVHSARDAIRHAQLAIPHHHSTPRGDSPDVVPTRGATPRLFAARWLLPHTRRDGVLGALAAPEALMLGWLWCAIAQEGLGAYQEALRCYSRALGVAHIDRKAALAMTEQLKKKIALTELASFGSEEVTGLIGQRLERSDFSTGVPYAASVVGMLSKAPPQHRAPPPLKSAERDRARAGGGHRAAPQLGSGRRSAGRLHATLMGAATAAGPSAGVWSYTPSDTFGPPRHSPVGTRPAASRPLFARQPAAAPGYRQPPPRPDAAVAVANGVASQGGAEQGRAVRPVAEAGQRSHQPPAHRAPPPPPTAPPTAPVAAGSTNGASGADGHRRHAWQEGGPPPEAQGAPRSDSSARQEYVPKRPQEAKDAPPQRPKSATPVLGGGSGGRLGGSASTEAGFREVRGRAVRGGECVVRV